MLRQILRQKFLSLPGRHSSPRPHLPIHNEPYLVQLPKHLIYLRIVTLGLVPFLRNLQISLHELIPLLLIDLGVFFKLVDDPLALLVEHRILVVFQLHGLVHVLDLLILYFYFFLSLFHLSHAHFDGHSLCNCLLQGEIEVLGHLVAQVPSFVVN